MFIHFSNSGSNSYKFLAICLVFSRIWLQLYTYLPKNTQKDKRSFSLSLLRLKYTTKCDFIIYIQHVCVCVSLYCFVRKTKRKIDKKKYHRWNWFSKTENMKQKKDRNPWDNRECFCFHLFIIVFNHAICWGRVFWSLNCELIELRDRCDAHN